PAGDLHARLHRANHRRRHHLGVTSLRRGSAGSSRCGPLVSGRRRRAVRRRRSADRSATTARSRAGVGPLDFWGDHSMKRITGISTLVAATLLAMSLGACSRHGSESRQPSMQATGAEVQAVRGDARSSLEDARQELSEAMQELDKAQRNLAQTVTEEARQDAKDAVQEAMSKIEDANEKLDEALRERTKHD